MKKIVFLVIVLVLISCMNALAEEVVLPSGKIIDGKIIEETDKYITNDDVFAEIFHC